MVNESGNNQRCKYDINESGECYEHHDDFGPKPKKLVNRILVFFISNNLNGRNKLDIPTEPIKGVKEG